MQEISFLFSDLSRYVNSIKAMVHINLLHISAYKCHTITPAEIVQLNMEIKYFCKCLVFPCWKTDVCEQKEWSILHCSCSIVSICLLWTSPKNKTWSLYQTRQSKAQGKPIFVACRKDLSQCAISLKIQLFLASDTVIWWRINYAIMFVEKNKCNLESDGTTLKHKSGSLLMPVVQISVKLWGRWWFPLWYLWALSLVWTVKCVWWMPPVSFPLVLDCSNGISEVLRQFSTDDHISLQCLSFF